MHLSDPRSECDCACVCVKVSVCVCVCNVHVQNIRSHPRESGVNPSHGHQRNADGLEWRAQVAGVAECWLPYTPILVVNGWKQRLRGEPRRPYHRAASLGFAAPASFGRV